MHSGRKAQSSFEYLMIFGLVMVFAIPIWLYVTSLDQQTDSQLALSYADSAVRQIADSADLVYSQGPPAKVRLRVYLPDGIDYTNVTSRVVNIRLTTNLGPSDVYATSVATLNGSLPSESGTYWIDIEAMDGFVQIESE